VQINPSAGQKLRTVERQVAMCTVAVLQNRTVLAKKLSRRRTVQQSATFDGNRH
jgi:hypothetical protein